MTHPWQANHTSLKFDIEPENELLEKETFEMDTHHFHSISLIFQLFWFHVNPCNCNLGKVFPLPGCELLMGISLHDPEVNMDFYPSCDERLDPGFGVTRIPRHTQSWKTKQPSKKNSLTSKF